MPSSKREALLNTATRLFTEQGFKATGIAAILGAAGVAKGTLYQHFESKEALIEAVLRRMGEHYRARFVEAIERAAEEDLVRERVRGVLTIPPGYDRDLRAGRGAEVQLLLDGSDANTATIAQNYAEVIVARAGLMPPIAGGVVIQTRTRIWYNETLESRNMIVPALIAVIMSIIAAMLTALTIAREWERGTMEQLAATPVQRTEVVLGKLVPYVAIGILDVTVAVIAGRVVFHVPLRGSIVLLAVLTLMFLVAALSWGIFVSAALKSQLLATQVAMITTYLPALLLSGFIFSIAAMPLVLRMVTLIVPARYFVVITRGIFLKDVGLGVLWPEVLALVVFATGALSLALRSFRKQLA